ncbi:MAG: 2TM domain-containing protein [Prevotellaceae bacterium]|jgi:hypothetical protein|nr:2TM domain-containing protein [Prevotellaceae bacterium]
MEIINNNEARQRAERRVNEISGFYSHLFIYCIVNAGLFLLNYFSTPHHLWFFYPLLGWGIGVMCHALRVFGCGLWGDEWKERKINQLMEKQKK